MIKDIMNANDSATPNSREMAVLKENFPSCFKADGSFDIERFKEFLSDKIAVTGEGYELKFLGKNYARLLASIDTTTVVVPDEEHNLKPENMNSENIYISGDNLDGLKHLLKSYSRKVKLIYIDPPYNTGTDGFVYNDSFNFTIEELSEKLSISEEQAKRILDLTKRGSASHSAWLMFMYSRLLLARDLLSDDGLIFISIDDNENHNLKLLCDDVFGEDNFRNQIAIRRGAKSVQAQFETWDKLGQSVEYLLFYSRNSSYRFPKQMKLLDDMRQGSWNNHWRGTDRPTMRYPLFGITPESGQWRWGKERSYLAIENYKKMLNDIGVDEKSITQEQIDEWYSNQDDDCDLLRLSDSGKPEHYIPPTDSTLLNTSWMDLLVGSSSEIKRLFGKTVFDTAKLTAMLQRVIAFADNDAIILDFFSGSASTAHAVMALNAEDGGTRKYIMVQIPEKVKEGSIADKCGYSTIDQIGMDRIKQAAKAIKTDYPDTTADLGFKHYTLVEPASDTLDKIEKFDPTENKLFADKDILSDFGKPTVLATWLVRDGYGLTADAEELNFAGYNGYYIGKHLYLIDPELSNKAIEAIVVKYETDGSFNPENVVLFGYSFTWTEMEALKINLKRLKDTEKNLRINFDIRY
ncbi:site-specific DNA-methyltransferase [Clostridium sp. WLY-B-L2]|uniref:Site-specific DNA-methyltransferase n=1 Tax=Clostridium aromativorans TaxID=2836848 RepID=A0ABS8N8H4_9CLOT|nr:site-specific DNA-methyltransferase [Clostridium aromativorans]MCC9295370.1 site-specific DNA-methyltransferase [Clostridium aromativorans]